jgi:integrase
MSQLPLFSQASDTGVQLDSSARSDPDSVRLLAAFRHARLEEGAHPESARREVSQLRAVIREAGLDGQPSAIRALFSNLDLIARVLREPVATISQETGRARLRAVQRFIWLMGSTLGHDPATDFATLDALLPARRAIGWHTTGTIVAGTPARRRRRGPTLDAADLRRIVDAAGGECSGHSARDRALVALHCFSGLRPEEIVRLRWQELTMELTVHGRYGLTTTVERGGRLIRMLLPGPASDAIGALAEATNGPIESLSGPVFCARGASGRVLSYRAARDVLQGACKRAGLPSVESTALRAACAYWLRGLGLSDHEVAAILGLARVRSIDRLLLHHTALDAQRTVGEMLARRSPL